MKRSHYIQRCNFCDAYTSRTIPTANKWVRLYCCLACSKRLQQSQIASQSDEGSAMTADAGAMQEQRANIAVGIVGPGDTTITWTTAPPPCYPLAYYQDEEKMPPPPFIHSPGYEEEDV